MVYDFRKNERQNRECTGTLKCTFIEPALALFFGEDNPTEREVPVEFIVHNTWSFGAVEKDQYLTLTKIDNKDLVYKVPYTSQEGDVDLWETIDTEKIRLNIMIGIDRFYITNIQKK